MAHETESNTLFQGPNGAGVAENEVDKVPTKAEILNDIRAGYLFVMSGGRGQPIDEMHREIADELAREELAEYDDIR